MGNAQQINPHEIAARMAKAGRIATELTKASCATGVPLSAMPEPVFEQALSLAVAIAKVNEPSAETKRVVRVLLGIDRGAA